MRKGGVILAALLVAAVALPASADPVLVTVTGEVEFNQINRPPLDAVGSGETATMTFAVDSDVWEDNLFFPTRHYTINPMSYSLKFDSAEAELQDPFPAGFEPLFVIRDNDPAVDGFFTSINPNNPFGWGLPLNTTGIFGQFADSFRVTYTGDTLSSLDILDAQGTYDFTNLTVFGWTIDDGPFNAMFIVFSQMTIEAIPVDDDGDGVPNDQDLCPDTVIPESVPTRQLGVNRWALVDDDLVFDTTTPPGGGNGPGFMFDTADMGGCSCEQVIEERSLGNGHTKFGCSNSVMLEWADMVAGSGYLTGPGGSHPTDLGTTATGGVNQELSFGAPANTQTETQAGSDSTIDRLSGATAPAETERGARPARQGRTR